MLHLHGASIRHPQPSRMHGKELQLQTDAWLAHARDVALAVPSIDYVGWHGEHFVVVRHNHQHHHHHHHGHHHHHHHRIKPTRQTISFIQSANSQHPPAYRTASPGLWYFL